jgi:hypothetical protein
MQWKELNVFIRNPGEMNKRYERDKGKTGKV